MTEREGLQATSENVLTCDDGDGSTEGAAGGSGVKDNVEVEQLNLSWFGPVQRRNRGYTKDAECGASSIHSQ